MNNKEIKMPSTAEDRIRALASPDHILVATDLTDTDYLLPHAIAQARNCGARLTLVHAITPPEVQPVESGATAYINETKRDRDARLMLMELKRQIEGHGLVCNTVCRHGFASDVIHEELERTGAKRLIVGTHGRGKLGQMMLGSLANDLLKSVRVPVFTVGPGARSAGRQSRPQRILHPVSFTGDYIESLHLAFDLAQTYKAELTLLHVLPLDIIRETVNPARTFAWAEKALRSLLPDTDDPAPGIHTKVVAGDLVKEIMSTAAETEADLIVVGMDGALPLFHFRDSTAYKVTAAAHCPVLAFHHAQPRKEAKHEEADRFAGVIG
jgi:nucleotide-binding universal stress UspA family protein